MADTGLNYLDSKNYVNRELSWLEFDFRILNEARDKSIPLFERLKFLSLRRQTWMSFYGSGGVFEGYGTCKIQKDGYCRSEAGGAAGVDRRKDP